MTLSALHCLIATAVFANLGAVGTLVAFQFGRREAGDRIAIIGSAGGFLCAGMAALIMSGGPDAPEVVGSPIWNWVAFSGPRSLVIGFGLDATSTNASLISLAGLIACFALTSSLFRKVEPLSDGVVLAASCLYAALVDFAFSPGLAQALLSWGAVSLFLGILIHLARVQRQPHRIDVQGRSIDSTEPQRNRNIEHNSHRGLHAMASWLAWLERNFVNRVWRSLTIRLPASIVEQLELIESTSVSFQLTATVLGAFAVLLTWLMVNV